MAQETSNGESFLDPLRGMCRILETSVLWEGGGIGGKERRGYREEEGEEEIESERKKEWRERGGEKHIN